MIERKRAGGGCKRGTGVSRPAIIGVVDRRREMRRSRSMRSDGSFRRGIGVAVPSIIRVVDRGRCVRGSRSMWDRRSDGSVDRESGRRLGR